MSDPQFNPNDPLFLASQAMDGELAPADAKRLEEALRRSPALRDEAEQLRAVDELVCQWGVNEQAIDWRQFAASVELMSVTEAESKQLEKVDALVRQWGAVEPDIDMSSFADDVLAEIQPQQRQHAATYRRMLRVGVPLAAAAAVVFAVMSFVQQPIEAPTNIERIGPMASTAPVEPQRVALVTIRKDRAKAPRELGPIEPPRSAVSFGKDVPDDCVVGPVESDIAMIAMSSNSVIGLSEEYPSM